MASADPTDRFRAPGRHRPGVPERRRVLVLGAVVGLISGVVGIAVVTRAHGSAPGAGNSTAPTSPIAARFPSTSASHPRSTVRSATAPTTSSTTATTTITRPPQTTPAVVVTSPPPTAAITAPTTALLPAVTATLPPPLPPLGAEFLTWTAPPVLDIVAGKTAHLSVQAHNPTPRTVALSHPLSCTPRIDHGEMCSDIVQLIDAGQMVSASYTIDAHGVAPGHYTLVIEGVLTVPVTVS